MFNEFVTNIEVHFKGIVTNLATVEINHQDSFSYILDELVELRRLVCKGSSFSNQAEGRANKIEVPEPKPSVGVQNEKELENFVRDMEHYFRVAHVLEGEKINITSM